MAQIYANVTTLIDGDIYNVKGKLSKDKKVLHTKKGTICHILPTDTVCMYCNYKPKRETTTCVSDFVKVNKNLKHFNKK